MAAMSLPPGVILDGEAVVYVAADDGTVHISFTAAGSRPRRAREPAAQTRRRTSRSTPSPTLRRASA
ncbi:hypothetical protein [Streptomyces bluensis]|uniref:Uncharacterized protein n=1 Tax=Streptomyces bluensis TaxID=33897 RepID=A0ABW6UBA6_9ACTN